MILKELTVNGSEWEYGLRQFHEEQKDIFFLPNWYNTWLNHENATAHCLYIIIDDFHFLYPFLKSKIEGYELNDDYYDIQTAYGYGGVIVNKHPVPEVIGRIFNRLTTEWLVENKVVAEFIRVHPLLDNFRRDCKYSLVRKNVFIETTNTYKIPDKQARQNVAKAKSMGAEIVYDFNLEFMDRFIELYRMTVERIKMDQYYNFGNDYFNRVAKELKEFSTLIHISVDNKIIGSGLYLHYGNKATLHLVGSNSNYQHVRINDLLYHGAIQLSIKNNISTLNVGGGTSLNPEDTLFKFKSKFSHNFKDVLIGKNVINQDVYNNLINQWTSMNPDLSEKSTNYFLKYRIKGNLQLARK